MTKKKPISIEVSCPECGSIFHHTPHPTGKPRSPEQHRRFFLMFKLAFAAWPETAKQFLNAEDMRYWFTMKVGYREVRKRIPLTGLNKQQAMWFARRIIEDGPDYQVPQLEGNEVVIYVPKSVSFLKMGHLEFNALNTAIQDALEEIGGIKIDQLIDDYFKLKLETAHRERERAPRYVEEKDFP